MRNLILSLIIILSMNACGTVFNGGSQDIQIDSNVSGVEIYINGMKTCKTPCAIPIERSSSSIVINAKKRGYIEQQMMLKSELSGISILNLTFWPSWLTDVATGGMWKYNRDGVYIEMETLHQNTQQRYYDRYSKNDKTGAKTRRFTLYNYGELKAEASSNKSGEYIKTLSVLTGKDEVELIATINKSSGEVNLAHNITGITH